MINIILSGGVGSRLWPLSRQSRPKQYIPLFKEKSLLQLCALRNKHICEQLIIVGNKNNEDLSRRNLKDIGISNFTEIIEAAPRNTAAAIAFAAFRVSREDILLVTPSDHVIIQQQNYEAAIKEAKKLAEKEALITFGIQPTRPETGYGYIEYKGNEVLSFREKPNEDVAGEMLQSGRFLWNSGMFCFKAGVFLTELKKYAPQVYEKSLLAWENKSGVYLPKNETDNIPAKSVDYAVMEHSRKIKIVPAKNLGWSDLGTYDSLWTHIEQQKDHPSTQKNLVLGTDKPVFFLEQENMVFVETDDAILVLPRAKSQRVKQLYEQLAKERPDLIK